MNKKQRYICNTCKYQFTSFSLEKRGYSQSIKDQAIQMSIEGMRLRAIGRILHIHNTTVLKWIKQKSNGITVSFGYPRNY